MQRSQQAHPRADGNCILCGMPRHIIGNRAGLPSLSPYPLASPSLAPPSARAPAACHTPLATHPHHHPLTRPSTHPSLLHRLLCSSLCCRLPCAPCAWPRSAQSRPLLPGDCCWSPSPCWSSACAWACRWSCLPAATRARARAAFACVFRGCAYMRVRAPYVPVCVCFPVPQCLCGSVRLEQQCTLQHPAVYFHAVGAVRGELKLAALLPRTSAAD